MSSGIEEILQERVRKFSRRYPGAHPEFVRRFYHLGLGSMRKGKVLEPVIIMNPLLPTDPLSVAQWERSAIAKAFSNPASTGKTKGKSMYWVLFLGQLCFGFVSEFIPWAHRVKYLHRLSASQSCKMGIERAKVLASLPLEEYIGQVDEMVGLDTDSNEKESEPQGTPKPHRTSASAVETPRSSIPPPQPSSTTVAPNAESKKTSVPPKALPSGSLPKVYSDDSDDAPDLGAESDSESPGRFLGTSVSQPSGDDVPPARVKGQSSPQGQPRIWKTARKPPAARITTSSPKPSAVAPGVRSDQTVPASSLSSTRSPFEGTQGYTHSLRTKKRQRTSPANPIGSVGQPESDALTGPSPSSASLSPTSTTLTSIPTHFSFQVQGLPASVTHVSFAVTINIDGTGISSSSSQQTPGTGPAPAV